MKDVLAKAIESILFMIWVAGGLTACFYVAVEYGEWPTVAVAVATIVGVLLNNAIWSC